MNGWPREGWSVALGRVVAVAIMVIMSARILDTRTVFSGTFDESMHITAAMEHLTQHKYTYAMEHTPLARIPAAIGPLLAGAQFTPQPGAVEQADAVMRSGPGYLKNLELARVGIVPFFVLAGVFLFLWTRHVVGEPTAVAAIFLFSQSPPVLAHSGLVTTDAAAMASFTALIFTFQVWLEQPNSVKRTIWLGVAAGAAVASKLSAIPFFMATAGLLMIVQFTGWRRSATIPNPPLDARMFVKRCALASAIAVITLYATYGFTLGRALGFPAPLSEFVFGLMILMRHNMEGNASYLLGEAYYGGRWLFFPIVIAVKTPIPLLLLATVGGCVASLRWWRRNGVQWLFPIAAFIAPLAVASSSNINLGIRHVLPVLPALAMLGGVGLLASWQASRATRGLAAALCAWILVGTWRSHPDYLAYFNEFANDDPGAVLVESDLDWGQDLERLADTVRARSITDLSITYFGFPDRLGQLFPHARSVGPLEPRPTGWYAVSETLFRRGWVTRTSGNVLARRDSLTWLKEFKPVAQIGASIRLYFIPP